MSKSKKRINEQNLPLHPRPGGACVQVFQSEMKYKTYEYEQATNRSRRYSLLHPRPGIITTIALCRQAIVRRSNDEQERVLRWAHHCRPDCLRHHTPCYLDEVHMADDGT